MSLQTTFEQETSAPQRREFQHELFELCMEQVDRGELAPEDVPARMAHLSFYFSSVGGRAAVAENVQMSASTPTVTTAVIEKSSAR